VDPVYAFSRFQGEGAAAEIREVLLQALTTWRETEQSQPDAVVILRGGGAVNDLAWLNNYDLARSICELNVPVLTGIGHERDSTVLDEVAHTKFDTPSKVILGIEQAIARRTSEAKSHFAFIARTAAHLAQVARRETDQADASIKAGAQRHLSVARQHTASLLSELQLGAAHSVREATTRTADHFNRIGRSAREQLAVAQREVPSLYAEVRAEARQAVKEAKAQTLAQRDAVLERSAGIAAAARQNAHRAISEVATGAKQIIAAASTSSESLVREITGQGPDKTLQRGFGIVRDAQGQPITTTDQVTAGQAIHIQLRDGSVAAHITAPGDTP
jgi:exodeoxyribonuclease VII large subunit